MNSAKVIESIYDLSGRVGTSPGVYAAVCLPDAPKGPVNEPFFVTSVDALLDTFTTEGTIKPSYNMAFFEAQAYLERANKLYVIRPDTNQLYGGSRVPAAPAAKAWKAAEQKALDSIIKPADLPAIRIASCGYQAGDFMRPTADAKFKFKCITAGVTSSTFDEDEWSTVTAAGQQVLDGTAIWESVALNHPNNVIFKVTTAGISGAEEPVWPTEVSQTEVTDGTVKYQVIAATTASGLEEGEKDPELEHVFGEDEAVFFYGKYPGADNNDIGYRIYNYETYPDLVKEPDSFLVEVYRRGSGARLEAFNCSRDINKKDGYGQNIYVETALNNSQYLAALDNPAIPASKNPIDVLDITYLSAGSDGDACTDGKMILAMDRINNRMTYPVKLLLDGGWTTATYHRKLNAIAKTRQDCLAILSTPYSAENSTNYITNILNYRNQTLNLNSYWSALYTPHVEIYDQYNDRYLWIGPGSSAAATISEISSKIAPWYPPAGLQRGILDSVSNVKIRFDEPQMDLLCNSQINPVAFMAGEGIVIWGNQTLYSRPSALQELHIMLLIIEVMPQIAKALKYYLFEFNDSDTRGLIKTIVDDYMKDVQAGKGVEDWECSVHATDEQVDSGILYVDLLIKPKHAINEIRFRIVPVKSGASFTTALEILEG